MNAERLHVIARAIRNEMDEIELVDNLQQLRGSLQNLVNQPQQPAHQQAVDQKLRELGEQLDNAPSNRFGPSWRQVLQDIGAEPRLGSNLAAKLREVFQRHQITPAVALQEIQAIQEEVGSLQSAIAQLTDAFSSLHISAQDLEPGESEIGFLVPRAEVNNRLEEFAAELREINLILSIFSEIVTTKRDGFGIRSLSSSDLMLYLDITPAIAACFAVALERLIRAYKNILEIRKLRAQLRKQDVPDVALRGIDEHANGTMKQEIDQLVGDIFKEYSQGSKERGNELRNGLRISLNKLANRIDRGYNVEIRVEPMEPAKEEGEQTDEEKAARNYIATLLDKAPTLQFIRLGGKPILSLPESEETKGGGKTGKKS